MSLHEKLLHHLLIPSISNLSSLLFSYDENSQSSFGELTFKSPVIESDKGEYYCTAFWTKMKDLQVSSNSAYWAIYGIELKPAAGVKGAKATMTCEIKAVATPETIGWFQDGSFLDNQPSFDYKVCNCLYWILNLPDIVSYYVRVYVRGMFILEFCRPKRKQQLRHTQSKPPMIRHLVRIPVRLHGKDSPSRLIPRLLNFRK